jgi:ribosome recycling factor
MDKKQLIDELKTRMEKALGVLDHELKGLRTGRASVNLLDPVQVEAYGDRMPISQLGTVSTPDARMLVVQVWDKAMVKAVEKAIVDANLGLNPASDGQNIRLPIPPLSEERRKELAKLAGKYGENTKVAIRNVRRDGMDELKKLEKAGIISEDQLHTIGDDIQKLTDKEIENVDKIVKQKEQEITSI